MFISWGVAGALKRVQADDERSTSSDDLMPPSSVNSTPTGPPHTVDLTSSNTAKRPKKPKLSNLR